MVYDLLVKTHPDLTQFMLSNTGHIGWARKAGGRSVRVAPERRGARSDRGAWSESFDGVRGTRRTSHNARRVHRTGPRRLHPFNDHRPACHHPTSLEPPGPIDYVTLRLMMLTPDMESVQLFWVGEDDAYFSEERSTRCLVRSSSGVQDLTFAIPARPMRDRSACSVWIRPMVPARCCSTA